MRLSTEILVSLLAITPAVISAPAPQVDSTGVGVGVTSEGTSEGASAGTGVKTCTRGRGGRGHHARPTGAPSGSPSAQSPGSASDLPSPSSVIETPSAESPPSGSPPAESPTVEVTVSGIPEPTKPVESPSIDQASGPSAPANAETTASPVVESGVNLVATGATGAGAQQTGNAQSNDNAQASDNAQLSGDAKPSATSSATTTTTTSTGSDTGIASEGFEAEILRLSNEYRAQFGKLPSLPLSSCRRAGVRLTCRCRTSGLEYLGSDSGEGPLHSNWLRYATCVSHLSNRRSTKLFGHSLLTGTSQFAELGENLYVPSHTASDSDSDSDSDSTQE